MKYFIIIVLTTIAIGLWQHSETESHRATVYQVCNASRISPTISEGECGKLQDKWGIEFLCASANSDPTNYCWTEVK